MKPKAIKQGIRRTYETIDQCHLKPTTVSENKKQYRVVGKDLSATKYGIFTLKLQNQWPGQAASDIKRFRDLKNGSLTVTMSDDGVEISVITSEFSRTHSFHLNVVAEMA